MPNTDGDPLVSARPIIRLDGADNDALAQGLLALMVEEATEGLYRCEATFGNWGARGDEVDYLYFDRDTLDFGRRLAVRVGEGGTEAEIFDGQITGLEAEYPQARPPEIVVRAEDGLRNLRMTRRTRSFESVTDSDVIRQIASEHALQAEVDIDDLAHYVLAQVNQSDLAFVRQLARAVDAEVWVTADLLHVQARGRRETSDLTLSYGQELLAFSVLADLAKQRTSLTVSGWDVTQKQSIVHTATESAIQPELNGRSSGSSILQSAFGGRAEQIVHRVPTTTEEAHTMADAAYRQMARRFLTGHGVCRGDGRLRVGSAVTLQGLGTLFDGGYYVTEVRHTYNATDGYRTAFRVERPGLGDKVER